MPDSGCEREYLARMQIMGAFCQVDAECASQGMNRNCSVRMMIIHLCPGLHCDEHQPKIVGLEEKLGISA